MGLLHTALLWSRKSGFGHEKERWCRVPQISPDHVGTVFSLLQAPSSTFAILCSVRIQLNITKSLSTLPRGLFMALYLKSCAFLHYE